MALLSEIQERSWASDRYGDNVLRFRFDWRDTRIMNWINNRFNWCTSSFA